jgi:rubredoxin
MDLLICPKCGANWREVGVKEYGLVYFETPMAWDEDDEFFEGDPDETRYGDCASMDWACMGCGYVLDDSPDNLAEDSD